MSFSKMQRIAVQRETLLYLERNKHKFDSSKTRKLPFMEFNPAWKTFPSTNIEVLPMDTLEAVVHLQEKHDARFSFLVFANAYHPGGGYKNGASAQEESICRRTNLVPCINTVRYPIPEFGCIHIKNLYIIRDTEERNYEYFKEPHVCNCILAAAYNHPPLLDETHILPEYRVKTRRKIHGFLNCLLANGDTNMVLGAFGCGAFANPPEDIAHLFVEILNSTNYKNRFENVYFAVIATKWKRNYQIFKRKIG
ncbi:MAG: TIGR02452 family protein [Candidatus Hodarchaeota archaeon]